MTTPSPERPEPQNSLSDTVTVCDKCLQASCWQGIFMCDGSRTAGTVEKTIAELIELNREHPSYWGRRVATRTPAPDVAGEPVCNCSGGDDGAWGLASHTSNCATQATPPLESDKDAEINRLKEKISTIKRAAMKAVGSCETWPDVLSEGPKLRTRIAEQDGLIKELVGALEKESLPLLKIARKFLPARRDQISKAINRINTAIAHAAEAMKQP